ncbi:MAG: PAS domain S-box protein [Dehalococcoidia bacterium]|nr:PAS domain S-box protein [Dehalococcoidia bacterium]
MEQGPGPIKEESGAPPFLLDDFLPAFIDGIDRGLLVLDSEYRVQVSNKFVQEWVKGSAEEIRGQLCYRVFRKRDTPCEDCPAAKTFQMGESAATVHAGQDKEGGVTYAQLTTHPIKDRSGRVSYVIEFASDVSERMRVEQQNAELLQALKESEEKYRTMVEHSNDAIWMLDRDGRLAWFNRRLEEVSGYALNELLGASFEGLVLPESRSSVRNMLAQTLGGQPGHHEVGLRRKSGERVILSASVAPVFSSGEIVGIAGFSEDVTESKRTEEQLRRRSNELEVLNAIGRAVGSSLDLNTVLERALNSVLQVMDLRPTGGIFLLDEAARELVLTVHSGLDPDLVEREQRVKIGECLCGQAAESGQLLYSADSILDERHSRPSGPEPHAHIVVPLKSHDLVQGILFLYPPPGHEMTSFEERLFTTVGGQIGIAIENARLYQRTDEQLQNKVVELTAALEVAERERARAGDALQLREEFLSVASHELKTPMTSLRGFIQRAMRQFDRGAGVEPLRIRQSLQLIEGQSEKLSRLISQLLDITRMEAGQLALEREVTDVTDLVRAVVENIQPASPRHRLVLHALPGVVALVDPLRLEQVVTNLVNNAIKYCPNGGQIDVEVTRRDADTFQIAVTDRGIGISPEHRDRIFDRFYQAHADGHFGGMGLGLYISREIVKLHGGQIDLDFPDEERTRFRVVLPVSTSEGGASAEAGAKERARRILVVDDDEAIVRLMRLTLSEEGYEVMDATHGATALELVQHWKPDLVLLDLRMPIMDGREFTRAYRQTPGPHAPIILVTAAQDASRPAGEVEADAYLEKPFDLDRLLEIVDIYSRGR